MTHIWILIIIVQGWGGGIGSGGNAIASVEFNSREACSDAAKAIPQLRREVITLCVPK